MPTSAEERKKVFVSYSHRDHEWLKRLQVHLRPLERRGLVEIWDDTKIRPGDEWRKEISVALDSAKVAILLISADFLASDFIAEDELPPLLAAAEKDGLLILPLILKASLFEETESLSKFQSVNPPSEPLINLLPGKQEECFVKLSKSGY
jgi:TIR domain